MTPLAAFTVVHRLGAGSQNWPTIPSLNIEIIPWQRLGHTVTVIKAGSHFRFQSRMQSCIKSCAGNYCYVKWWDGGPILPASTKARNESESHKWRQTALLPYFCLSLYFGTPNLALFRIFGGLAVFCQRGLKIQAMSGRSPFCGLVKQTHGRLSS